MLTKIKRSTVALLIGCLLAFSGLVCNGLYQADIWRDNKSTNVQSNKTEVILKIGKIEIKKTDKPQFAESDNYSKSDTKKYLRIAGAILGAVAILIAGISWVMSDSHRFAAVVVSMGLICLAWEYAMIAVSVAVVVLILGSLS